jgi:hypothetical protein
MSRFTKCLSLLSATALVLALSTATASAADPNGTWTWKFERQGGETVDISLDLKAEGEKLTGKIYSGERETEITDGVFKNDEVTFKSVRERNGNKFVMTYKGKVEGDAIKGTVEFQTPDQSRSRPWEAIRSKKS